MLGGKTATFSTSIRSIDPGAKNFKSLGDLLDKYLHKVSIDLQRKSNLLVFGCWSEVTTQVWRPPAR